MCLYPYPTFNFTYGYEYEYYQHGYKYSWIFIFYCMKDNTKKIKYLYKIVKPISYSNIKLEIIDITNNKYHNYEFTKEIII